MLDRLVAREQIDLINAFTYASGHMDPKQAGQFVSLLHERAHPDGEPLRTVAARPKSVAEMRARMMGDGFSGVRVVLEPGPESATSSSTAHTRAGAELAEAKGGES